MSESILKTLKSEHRQIQTILEDISECGEAERKKELYLQLKDALIPHMEGEEKSIYAHLLKDVHDEEAEEMAHHAETEHDEVRRLMATLDNIGIENDRWDNTFQTLRSQFAKHVEEEESELFAEAKVDFSKEELREFGDEFIEAKENSSHY